MLGVAVRRPAPARPISEDIPMASLPNFGAATFIPGAPIDSSCARQ